jgi:branched-chain amino acid transport system ATP-binding protein
MRSTGGRILFEGRDIRGAKPEVISRAGLVRSFQLARGCETMTVFEHLMLYAPRQRGEALICALMGGIGVRRMEEEAREHALDMARRLRLAQVIDNRVTQLSGGQKKLLEIGRVLLAKPRLILLDEPMAGVNPALVQEIAEHLIAVRDSGISILLIEHEMELIERLCDEVIVMANGKYLTHGSFSEIAADARVQESYLGMRRHG